MNRIVIPNRYQVIYTDLNELKVKQYAAKNRQYTITGLIINEMLHYFLNLGLAK